MLRTFTPSAFLKNPMVFLTGICLCLFAPAVFAQVEQDTVKKPETLQEVVVSGQFNPQSVDKSVFQVKVISRADIDRQAGNNLADVLNQTLNMSVVPNASTGKSGVQLFGLDAQYFKILVDNVPLVNDSDLGSDADLTQINLDDIQQIEIVEGSMGVDYGANAVAGIINIITRKSAKYKWEVTPFVQEETIGKEYNGISKGRHIQSVRISHNINDKWHANAMFTYNDFDGHLNDRKGVRWVQDDSLRGYEWLPKRQLNAKAYVGYSPNKNSRIFYRFEYFNELTKFYDAKVDLNYDVPTATYNEFSQDRDYGSERFVHLVNAAGSFQSGLTYDFYVSYQQQKRNSRNYTYFIREDREANSINYEYESRKVYYSKGSLSHFIKDGPFDFQLGYEVNQVNGYASSFAYEFISNPVARDLGTYDAFVSAEWKPGKKITLRPGARALFSSQFDTEVALSLSALYDMGNGYELRAIFGTCPRLPDYAELYSYFVDVNHNVQGNPDLRSENGISGFLHLNKTFRKGDFGFDAKLSGFYIDVNDRIELIQTAVSPPSFRYGNIDSYRTAGATFSATTKMRDWQLSLGATYSGVSKVFDSQTVRNDDFLYGFNANGNAAYTIRKTGTTFSVFGKYNGPQYQFVQQYDENQNPVIVRGKLSDYTLVDATIRQLFAGNRLEVTLGVRNLADITRLNNSAVDGAAHSAPATSQLLGYGRSYFLKLLYRFHFG